MYFLGMLLNTTKPELHLEAAVIPQDVYWMSPVTGWGLQEAESEREFNLQDGY